MWTCSSQTPATPNATEHTLSLYWEFALNPNPKYMFKLLWNQSVARICSTHTHRPFFFDVIVSRAHKIYGALLRCVVLCIAISIRLLFTSLCLCHSLCKNDSWYIPVCLYTFPLRSLCVVHTVCRIHFAWNLPFDEKEGGKKTHNSLG